MIAGVRVEVNERKRDPLDFVLWKASKEREPSWSSPWGPGRPGWHIECSAMSMKHLAETFDIHAGGKDLIFPHHENEIAQSEAYTGKPFAKLWMHNGFVNINQEKMSKSLGNFFTIKEILNVYDPEVVRFFLLSTHYRSPIDFSDRNLEEAEGALNRFYTTMERVDRFLTESAAGKGDESGGESSWLSDEINLFKNRFEEAMDDDFNTAQSLGHIFELLRSINRFLDKKEVIAEEGRAILKLASDTLKEKGKILSLFQRDSKEWVKAVKKVKGTTFSEEEIQKKIGERNEARDNKDWKKADMIRKELEKHGILLEDRPEGTVWKVKR